MILVITGTVSSVNDKYFGGCIIICLIGNDYVFNCCKRGLW